MAGLAVLLGCGGSAAEAPLARGPMAEAHEPAAAPSAGSLDPERALTVRATLDALAAAFDSVTEWLGDDEARCRWASADVGLRLNRLNEQFSSRQTLIEADEYRDNPWVAHELSIAHEIYRARERFTELDRLWSENAREAAPSVRRVRHFPDVPVLTPDWEAIGRQIEVARTSCGWGH